LSRPLIVMGDKTSHGGTVISAAPTTDPSGGAAPGATGSATEQALTEGFGLIGEGLMAGYQDEPLDDQGQRFRGRFQVLDSTRVSW
jgi:hypothetical protein